VGGALMARRTLEVRLVGDEKSLLRSFNRGGAAVNRFGDQTTRLHARVTKSFGGMAVSMAKFGAASAGIAGAGIAIGKVASTTIEFDKAMRNVNSIAQLSEKRFGSLEKQVRSLAGKTAQAPKTLAEGLYDLVSSGFNSSQSMRILASSAKAATAGLTTTEISTHAVAAVLNAYHKPASAAAKVSDQLFQTVNLGVISFEQLASTLGDVLPFASSLGIGLDQVGASISTMTKAGIGPEETMTRIKNVMVALLKPSKPLSAAYKDIGVTSGEALIKQKGFQGALETLIGTTDGSKQSVAELFPNIRALGGALALTGANAKGAERDLAGFKDVSGATDRALSQQKKSISHSWQEIKSKIDAASIAVGSVLIPAVSKGLGGLEKLGGKASGAVQGVVDKFNDLRKGTSAKDAGLSKHFEGMTALAAPKGKGTFSAIGTMISDSIKGINWQSIGDTMGAGLSTAFSASGKLPALIAQGLGAAFSQVNGEQVLGKLVDVLGDAVDALFLPSFWIKHFKGIFATVTIIIPVAKIFKIPGASFLYNLLSRPLFALVKALGTGVVRLFGKVGAEAVLGFVTRIESVFPRVGGAIAALESITVARIKSLPGALSKIAGRAGAGVVSRIAGAAGAAGDAAGRVVVFLLRPFANVAGRVGARMASVGRAIVAPLHALGARMLELGVNLVKSLASGVLRGAQAAVDAVGSVGKSVVSKAKSVFKIGSPSKEFQQIGEWISQGLADGIASGKSMVDAAVKAGLLYPMDAAIAALNAQKDKLQASFDAWDSRRQRADLVAGITSARTSGSSSSSPRSSGGGATGTGVIGGGKFLQGLGLQVGESKYFGGVTTNRHAHYPNDHYSGNSIDVNAAGGGAAELSKLKAALAKLRKAFGDQIQMMMIEDAGAANQHLHVTFKSAGKGAVGGTRAVASQVRAALGKGKASGGGHPIDVATDAARRAGFRGEDLVKIVAIAARESSYNPKSTNLKYPDHSIGLWQINQLAHKGKFGSDKQLEDPYTNAKAAYALFKNRGNFQDWKGPNGDPLWNVSKAQLAAARKAVLASRGGAGVSGVKGGDGGSIADAIKGLKDFDRESARAKKLAAIDVKIKGLEALKAYKDALKDIGGSLKDLAAQGASTWRSLQEKAIDTTAEIAHASVANGPNSAELGKLLGQDKIDDYTKGLADAKQGVTDAQFLVDHSGGQTHVDALKSLKEATDALDRFNRTHREQELQDWIDNENSKVDASASAQKDSLDQQELDYRDSLQRQFDTLKGALEGRKISYKDFVTQVNAIMAPLGGEFQGSPDQEAAVNATAPVKAKPKKGFSFVQDDGPRKGQSYNVISKNGKTYRVYESGDVVARALGGPVTGDKPYVVGERGPELFVPRQSGTIVPNDKMRGSARGDVTLYLTQHGDVRVGKTNDARIIANRIAFRLAHG
jgi:TP901 family phage tail tape measure protein